MRTSAIADDRTRAPSFRWGAIVAGAIWGLALMAVLTSMWLALAYRSGIDVVLDDLPWFLAGSGAFSLFVAGLIAGSLADRRAAGAGFVHGMTAWALLLVGTLALGVPWVFGLFDADRLDTIGSADLAAPESRDALWATFLTLTIGAAAAAVGGAVGGVSRGRSTAWYDRDTFVDVTETARGDDDGTTIVRRPDESPQDLAGTGSGEHVMVRRAQDGSYVDQYGNRYVLDDV